MIVLWEIIRWEQYSYQCISPYNLGFCCNLLHLLVIHLLYLLYQLNRFPPTWPLYSSYLMPWRDTIHKQSCSSLPRAWLPHEVSWLNPMDSSWDLSSFDMVWKLSSDAVGLDSSASSSLISTHTIQSIATLVRAEDAPSPLLAFSDNKCLKLERSNRWGREGGEAVHGKDGFSSWFIGCVLGGCHGSFCFVVVARGGGTDAMVERGSLLVNKNLREGISKRA